ncbi:MAG: DUF4468 domain-containing protein [Prevotellaceae bacterium]|jgi:hypothetical protein|nr:DUF4468 domain-containing protein [Prevotellaceae bacterium]
MYQNITKTTAGAFSSAMERETISKNRVSPKNVRSRGNIKSMFITKIVLFIAILYIPFFANAQSAKEIYKYFDEHSSIIKANEKSVEITKILNIQGKSREWLYEKLQAWTIRRYNNPNFNDANTNTALISADSWTYSLKNKGNAFNGGSWSVYHSLTIEIKNEKVRIIYTLSSICGAEGLNDGVSVCGFSCYAPQCYPYKTKKNKKALYEYYYAFYNIIGWLEDIENILTEKNSDW